MVLEKPVTIETTDGAALEAMLACREAAGAGVVVCHPHPLYGGDMASPVVTSVVETATARGLATLRFNFRGVGRSTGRHDGGAAEVLDAQAALAKLQQTFGAGGRIVLAGYSFGASITMRVAATQQGPTGIVLVAPPLGRVEPGSLPSIDSGMPVLVIAGRRDGYCTVARLDQLQHAWPHATVRIVDGADHFFFGHFRELDALLGEWLATVVPTSGA